MKGTKLAAVVGVLIVALLLAGVAAADTAKRSKSQETKTPKQTNSSRGQGSKSAVTESRADEARVNRDHSKSRIEDRDGEKRKGERENLESRPKVGQDSRALLEESVKAAYKGESKRFHRNLRSVTRDTATSLDRQEQEPEESNGERRVRVEEPEDRGSPLVVSVGGSVLKKEEQLEERIAQLEAADQAGLFTRPPASGTGGPVNSEEEFAIAREDIIARPVEPISQKRYVQIYQASAKRYGFTREWYVLAAVGKIESDHGENLGPSSAGAMGPMQFLPSTWSAYGVDGNKDGIANIMDPEDAIPAAAAYLVDGGAPQDWHAALYTYNHAGWYVRDVLEMAEGYRKLADDDEVEPYT